MFDEWNSVEFFEGANKKFEISGYQHIDLCIYYIYLINIYIANKSLFRNLYYTNSSVDMFGNTNDASARSAIKKYIIRFFGDNTTRGHLSESTISDHIINLIRIDLSQISQPKINDGIQFERECSKALQQDGYRIRYTPRTGDFGADLIAQKNGIIFVIQCKNTTKSVGIKAVQEAVAARAHYKADFSVVCTSGEFTYNAIELATSNNVIMCNVDQICKVLNLFN